MANIKRVFVNSQKQSILSMINDKNYYQKDIAKAYRMLIYIARNWDIEDWAIVNKAIVDRWSMHGLKRIKTMAWNNKSLR